MSIQIGTAAANLFLNETNRERLVLRSLNQSNMIVLTSTTGNTSVLIDEYTLGKAQTHMQFRQDRTVLLSMNTSNAFILPTMTCSNSLMVGCNVVIGSNVTIGGNTTIGGSVSIGANMVIGTNITAGRALSAAYASFNGIDTSVSTPLLRLSRSNVDAMSVSFDGIMRIPRGICIGTNFAASNSLLHVESNVFVRNTLFASNVVLNNIQTYGNSNYIDLTNNIFMRGDTTLQGNLTLVGKLIYNDTLDITALTVSQSLTVPNLIINTSNTTKDPILELIYDGDIDNGASSNIVSVTIRPNDSNIRAFVIDHHGHVGLGTDFPRAMLDIYGEEDFSSNMSFAFRYQDPTNVCNTICIDKRGNIGIGTTAPVHWLHVTHCDDIFVDDKPLVGVYNFEESNLQYRPMLWTMSNNVPVFTVDHKGFTTIGTYTSNNPYALDVADTAYARIPKIETTTLTSSFGCNIETLQSKLVDLNVVSTCNMVASNLFAGNAFIDSITTNGFVIDGFTISPTLMNIDVDSLWFQGSNVLFSPNVADFQTNEVEDGKLKIVVKPSSSAAQSSKGIVVKGANAPNGDPRPASIKVIAPSMSQFEIANDITTGIFGLNDDIMYVTFFGDNQNKISITSTTIDLMGKMQINNTGIGINQGNTPIDKAFQVRGDVSLQSSGGDTVLSVNSAQQFVGIGNANPNAKLDVQGNMIVRDNLRIFNTVDAMSNIGIGTAATNTTRVLVQANNAFQHTLVAMSNQGTGNTMDITTNNTRIVVDNSGNIGIGTNTPRHALDIIGSINFNNIFQSNAPFTPSQWTTSNNNIFYYGNVGIGTQTPRFGIDMPIQSCRIGCNVTLGSNLNVSGTIFSANYVTTSDRSVKIDLTPIPGALQKVNDMRGYSYYRTDLQCREIGLIAQDVQHVIPELVRSGENALLNIAYGNMAGLFVEAIRELYDKVSSLEKELKQLKEEGAHT